MWIGAVAWQVGYATVYAYVDVKDDTRPVRWLARLSQGHRERILQHRDSS
jgi:4-hydroxybenzoate polyprenyltransferase